MNEIVDILVCIGKDFIDKSKLNEFEHTLIATLFVNMVFNTKAVHENWYVYYMCLGNYDLFAEGVQKKGTACFDDLLDYFESKGGTKKYYSKVFEILKKNYKYKSC
jgi:hypothetical protein